MSSYDLSHPEQVRAWLDARAASGDLTAAQAQQYLPGYQPPAARAARDAEATA